MQAVENAQHSTWKRRISIQQGDIFESDFPQKFDLIVSNPPYFHDSLASRTAERDLARSLQKSHFDWLMQAKKWLAQTGKISFILPTQEAEKLLEQSKKSGLFCTKIYQIITKNGQSPKRLILTFQFEHLDCKIKPLVIYNEQNQYTPEFVVLTRDFYLKM